MLLQFSYFPAAMARSSIRCPASQVACNRISEVGLALRRDEKFERFVGHSMQQEVR